MTSGWNKTGNIRQETNLLQKIAHHNNTHHPCPSQHQRSLFGKRTINSMIGTMTQYCDFQFLFEFGLQTMCFEWFCDM